jgi:UDP-3-O-[3-hydroxymyristoyl] glucosamine N-acyltransferase
MIGNIEGFTFIRDCDVNLLGMATTSYSLDDCVLTFLTNSKYLENIKNNPSIKGIIVSKQVWETTHIPEHLGVIVADFPKERFFELHNKLADEEFYWKTIDNEIDETAKISPAAFIGEHSIKIGKHSVIEPNVVIHPGVIIGDFVTIRSGCQIGTNGFQFNNDGIKVTSVKTAGRVIIEDYVEIQHHSCVDRGILGGNTIIKKYAKVDKFVLVSHDNQIGERTFITAGSIFGGRVVIGKDCFIGMNATISNGLIIGDNSKVSLGAVVTKNVPANAEVSGNFAIEHQKYLEFIKTIR